MDYKLVMYPEWKLIPQEEMFMDQCIPEPNAVCEIPEHSNMFVPIHLYKKFINPVVVDGVDDPWEDEYQDDNIAFYNWVDEYQTYNVDSLD